MAPLRTLLRGPGRRWSTSAVRYEDFFSKQSAARHPSPIRALQPLVRLPGMISLGGGMPNPETFPFECATFKVKGDDAELVLEGDALREALQYSPTPGIPSLHGWLCDLQRREHSLDGDFSLCVSTGSQDALSKAFAALLDPGDSLVVEDPTYPGSLAFLQPSGANLVPIQADESGLRVDTLEATLDQWDVARDGPKPKVRRAPAPPPPRAVPDPARVAQAIYTIPTGSNPTGASLTLERKQRLVQCASRHNLLVLEDDPYYYLQFGGKRDPSLLSMDREGRVLRFDSFSKLFSSGVRIGFATGPQPLIERIELHTQATTLHTCGLAQAAVRKAPAAPRRSRPAAHSRACQVSTLLHRWGADGFDAHATHVSEFYRRRCDHFLACADRHLTGLASWAPPTAGMFVWLRIHGVEDTQVRSPHTGSRVMLPGLRPHPWPPAAAPVPHPGEGARGQRAHGARRRLLPPGGKEPLCARRLLHRLRRASRGGATPLWSAAARPLDAIWYTVGGATGPDVHNSGGCVVLGAQRQ